MNKINIPKKIEDFENVYYINLEYRTDRKEKVIEEFQGEIIEIKGELPQQYPDFDDEW
jgi:hypothetical protein